MTNSLIALPRQTLEGQISILKAILNDYVTPDATMCDCTYSNGEAKTVMDLWTSISSRRGFSVPLSMGLRRRVGCLQKDYLKRRDLEVKTKTARSSITSLKNLLRHIESYTDKNVASWQCKKVRLLWKRVSEYKDYLSVENRGDLPGLHEQVEKMQTGVIIIADGSLRRKHFSL